MRRFELCGCPNCKPEKWPKKDRFFRKGVTKKVPPGVDVPELGTNVPKKGTSEDQEMSDDEEKKADPDVKLDEPRALCPDHGLRGIKGCCGDNDEVVVDETAFELLDDDIEIALDDLLSSDRKVAVLQTEKGDDWLRDFVTDVDADPEC